MASDIERSDSHSRGDDGDDSAVQTTTETVMTNEEPGSRRTSRSVTDSGDDVSMKDAGDDRSESDEEETISSAKLSHQHKEEDIGSSESEDDEEASDDDGDNDGDNEDDTTNDGEEHGEKLRQGDDEHTEERVVTCLVCDDEIDLHRSKKSYLTCIKCDSFVHGDCALEKTMWKEEDGTTNWHCPNCSIISSSDSPQEKKKDKAPRLVRDLLPVSRGLQKPDSHSIFNQPLIAEGEDGGRSLRKRKSPTTDPVPLEKRRRKATPKALSVTDDTESVVPATRRSAAGSGPIARVLQYRPPIKPPPHKFILAFRLDQEKIERILSKPSRPGRRRRDRRRQPKILPPPVYQPPVPKFPALPTNHLIFPSMWGDRENEINAKPYGDILSDADADTSRSLPQLRDRELFEIARKEAEEERRKTSVAAEAEINGENANAIKPNRTVSGPPSKIKCIQFGKYVIDTFYAAPYPEEYSHESRLFICEFCLKYLPSEFVAYRHKLKCPAKHPPGDEIYRDGTISVWEVDGRKRTEYCQCLCLMAKMFLGSKTLYYDVEPFLFYILTEYDELGYHFVGYFSKEKRPASQNNVSCILVMPIHQRKGYATFLIDFSYLLTRIEGKDGSPEKPLSDMGLTAYRSYWDLTISRHLLANGYNPLSTKDLMQMTGMTADDVIHSLERLYAFVRDPVTKTYALRYDKQLYENIVTEFESKKHRQLKPGQLVWTPYIMGRSDQALLDGQPLQAIAPRDGDDVAVENSAEVLSANKGQHTKGHTTDAPISPRSTRVVSTDGLPPSTDPLIVDGSGHIAPGPPPTEALTGTITSDRSEVRVNGIVGEHTSTGENVVEEELTGYALVLRNEKIPPIRFQIDPPIPASMLRNRLNKRKTPGKARVDGTSSQNTPTATRSSPRHGTSVAGSVNGNEALSPEKPSTPVRRSNRKSGLANMEIASIGGSGDDDVGEVLNELNENAQLPDEESTASSSDEEDIAVESTSGEEVDDGEDDADSSEDEDNDDDDEEEEEDDDDDNDPEVEIDEDEEDDEDEDEEED